MACKLPEVVRGRRWPLPRSARIIGIFQPPRLAPVLNVASVCRSRRANPNESANMKSYDLPLPRHRPAPPPEADEPALADRRVAQPFPGRKARKRPGVVLNSSSALPIPFS